MRSSMVLLVLLVCPLACAHGSTIEKLEVNTYRITCSDSSLDRCLHEAANKACDRAAYFVVRGISDVNNRGTSEFPNTAESSQAIVRCGPQSGWGDEGKALMSPAAPAAAPKPAASVCAPGSTQECIGTAACKGGQACKQDGSGYGPCDCGNLQGAPGSSLPPAPPSPPTPSPPTP